MSSLKKVLALSLALIMSFSLMTTGLAVGTDYTAYTDVSDIKYVDAVSLLSALDILRGLPSGAFNPKGDLTRAEVSKMLYVIMNNGIDDGAVLYKDAQNIPLSDIKGHWAEGYIKYCYSKGIVAGFETGVFKPNGNLTGVQAFKMILVSLGYDPIKEGYTGPGWNVNVAIDAQDAALTDKVEDVDVSKAINREIASQILFNGLFATMVHYPNGVLVKRLGDDSFTPLTFAWEKLGLKILEAVLIANDQVAVKETEKTGTDQAKEYGVAEDGHSVFKFKASVDVSGNITGIIGSLFNSTYTDAYVDIKVKTPYTLVGKAVNVFVKVKPGSRTLAYNWISGIEKVYGNVVEAPGKNIVVTATNDDYPKDNLNENTKFYVNYWDGKELSKMENVVTAPKFNEGTLAAKRQAFDNYYKSTARVEDPAYSKGQKVVLISNDGNKGIEYVLGFDKRFGEITAYANDKLTLTKNDSSNYKQGYYGVKFEDIHNVDAVKLGDRALMWKIFETGEYIMEVPESVTGTLTGSTSGSANQPMAKINDAQYKVARDHISYADVLASQFVGKEIVYYLDNGFIVGVNETGVTRQTDKYLVVRGSAVEGVPTSLVSPLIYKAAVLTSEGSKKTYEIASIYNRAGTKITDASMATNNPTAGFPVKYDTGADPGVKPIDNQVFRYTVNTDGKLVLYAPDAVNLDLSANYAKGAAVMSLDGGIGNKIVDNNTVAFVQNNSQEWFALIGRDNIPPLIASTDNEISALFGKFSVKDDLLKAVAITKADWKGTSSFTSKTGLILSSLATINSDNTWYYKELVLYTGNEKRTFTVKPEVRVGSEILGKGADVNAGSGRIVRYTLSGNEIDSLEFVDVLDPAKSGFDSGYVYTAKDKSLTLANSLPVGGNPVGTANYTLKDGGKIFLYDGTVEGSGEITSIPGQSLPSVSINDKFQYTYQAVVELDDTTGMAKNIFIYRDEQELDFENIVSDITKLITGLTETVAPDQLKANEATTFTVKLPTVEPKTGATIAWSFDKTDVSGVTGDTTGNTSVAGVATFTFEYPDTTDPTTGSIDFKGTVTAANGLNIEITKNVPITIS